MSFRWRRRDPVLCVRPDMVFVVHLLRRFRHHTEAHLDNNNSNNSRFSLFVVVGARGGSHCNDDLQGSPWQHFSACNIINTTIRRQSLKIVSPSGSKCLAAPRGSGTCQGPLFIRDSSCWSQFFMTKERRQTQDTHPVTIVCPRYAWIRDWTLVRGVAAICSRVPRWAEVLWAKFQQRQIQENIL